MPNFISAALRMSLLFTLLLLGTASWSAENSESTNATTNDKSVTTLDTQIQDLKKEVLDLNRDLFLLEEDLLFPANTQFSVFVSMDVGLMFDLDSVQLKLDNTVVGNHLYTEREINALKRGGVQRFYIGNLTSGEHELVAFFVGKGPKDRDYKRGTTLKITKGTEAQFVELKITDSESKLQPEFKAKVWEAE
jgi:hypothetical protein